METRKAATIELYSTYRYHLFFLYYPHLLPCSTIALVTTSSKGSFLFLYLIPFSSLCEFEMPSSSCKCRLAVTSSLPHFGYIIAGWRMKWLTLTTMDPIRGAFNVLGFAQCWYYCDWKQYSCLHLYPSSISNNTWLTWWRFHPGCYHQQQWDIVVFVWTNKETRLRSG